MPLPGTRTAVLIRKLMLPEKKAPEHTPHQSSPLFGTKIAGSEGKGIVNKDASSLLACKEAPPTRGAASSTGQRVQKRGKLRGTEGTARIKRVMSPSEAC